MATSDFREQAEQVRSMGMVYVLISEFVAPIVLGLILDWQAGTRPWGTLVGLGFGCLLGWLGVSRLVRVMSRNDRPQGPV